MINNAKQHSNPKFSQNSKWILILLTLMNLLNYVDRYLLAAVMPKLSAEMDLNHTQTGIILSAFMLGYFLTSPLFGYWADRHSRPKIIFLGTSIWSLATGVIGFCQNGTQVFLSRLVVGVGEASTITSSQTLMTDLFPKERRNIVMGIFLSAVPVGAAMGYILGGQMASKASWRDAFFIVFLPGILLALLALLIKEPRSQNFKGVETGPGSFGKMKGQFFELFKNKNYMNAVWGNTAFTFTLGGLASWVPQYLVKARGADLNTTAMNFGLITVVTGLVGSMLGGILATRFLKKKPRGDLHFITILIALSILPSFLAFGVQDNKLFFVFIAIAEFLLFATQPTVNVVFIESVPEGMQSFALAMSVFLMHLLGDLISPPLVGVLADLIGLKGAIFILPAALFASVYFFRKSYLGLRLQSR